MSHIIVRIDVVRDSRFVGTGMKNFDVSLSSFGRAFGDGSGAEAGESKMRQAWNSALRYYIKEKGMRQTSPGGVEDMLTTALRSSNWESKISGGLCSSKSATAIT